MIPDHPYKVSWSPALWPLPDTTCQSKASKALGLSVPPWPWLAGGIIVRGARCLAGWLPELARCWRVRTTEIDYPPISIGSRGETAMNSVTVKPTLYDRLGGVYSIAAVVDDFIDRVMHNPVLNANAAVDEAHHRVSAAGFKYYVTEMVCWATGGPQNYTGRSMSESHKHLKITESEWDAFCKDFDDTMAKFNVPAAEHKELFAIVESTKGDIVNAPSSL